MEYDPLGDRYPGYQRFFLARDEELSPGVGRRPKKRATKT